MTILDAAREPKGTSNACYPLSSDGSFVFLDGFGIAPSHAHSLTDRPRARKVVSAKGAANCASKVCLETPHTTVAAIQAASHQTPVRLPTNHVDMLAAFLVG